jgi:hypothetical protein
MATVVTVVFTMSFASRTNTQTTKLEEENQKALAAAEASIQVALKKKQGNSLGSGELTSISNYSGGATFNSATASTTFASPSVEKDGEYTFYLGAYTAGTPPVFGASAAEDVRVCFGSSGNQPALDIAVIKANAPKIRRYAVDPLNRISNVTTGTAGCAGNPTGVTYSYSYTIPGTELGTDARLMVIKPLYASTQLLFIRATGSTTFPSQGTIIQSTATSSTSGVTKKIQLFQSYPQIPIEFFSTIL